MARFDPTNVARKATTLGDKFIARDLLDLGVSYYGITRAIAGGYITALKSKRHTGRRGRPASELKLTAKGRKAVR